jgi:hypothetical protein
MDRNASVCGDKNEPDYEINDLNSNSGKNMDFPPTLFLL